MVVIQYIYLHIPEISGYGPRCVERYSLDLEMRKSNLWVLDLAMGKTAVY